MRSLLVRLPLLMLLLAPSASAVVTIDWVTVADPGNAVDSSTGGFFGAVAYEYRISKFEVSNTQYTEFLNAVASTDTNALYNSNMASGFGGITRSGSSGSFSYSAIAGREDMPVNWVSFYDSLRFANWLHNGQPVGAQGNTTTEDGAYTITPGGIAANSITRNAGATVFLTSHDEWYKAAYYKGGGINAGYWGYPAGTDTVTTCSVPGATANTANCDNAVADLTDRGSYTGSASPSGTFDQGGNVWEWIEAISTTNRVVRGGDSFFSSVALASSTAIPTFPSNENDQFGFRVASPVPAPPLVPSLSPLAIGMLGTLMGAAGIRRLRANQIC